jgi:exopolysaccharide biosynthesis polyprenyl glycosylphosphotransferase
MGYRLVRWNDPVAASGAVHLGWQLALKRCIDVVGALVLLVAVAPLFLLVAAAIKLTSRGPVFYRWRVVGKDARPFTGLKFRSMVVDADARKAALRASNEMRGPVFKMTNDPRVTPVGRFMRRYSLDELPQLLSVLKGDMSLVGPRPPLASEYAEFTPWQRRKLTVKPGMTCLWQVSGRHRTSDFDTWVALDLRYIENWSLWLDLKILLRTLACVVRGTGV